MNNPVYRVYRCLRENVAANLQDEFVTIQVACGLRGRSQHQTTENDGGVTHPTNTSFLRGENVLDTQLDNGDLQQHVRSMVPLSIFTSSGWLFNIASRFGLPAKKWEAASIHYVSSEPSLDLHEAEPSKVTHDCSFFWRVVCVIMPSQYMDHQRLLVYRVWREARF